MKDKPSVRQDGTPKKQTVRRGFSAVGAALDEVGHLLDINDTLANPYLQVVTDWIRYRLRRAKPWCGRAIERMHFQILMFVITIYALIGDDIRLAFTMSTVDIWFNLVTIFAFFLFAFEMIAGCIGKDDYFLSFFFFLDLVATASLVLDVTWFYSALFETDSSYARAGRMSRVGTRAGRVIRVIRLIRLIRIVKIYKHVVDISNLLSGKKKEVAKPGTETNDEPEVYAESRVGQKLSHMTTQKVIILILFMLIMLPIITVENFFRDLPTSSQYGSDVMYRALIDCAQDASSIACQDFEQQLAMYIGYHHRQHTMSCDTGWNQAFNSECKLDLGWIGFLKGSSQTTFNVDPAHTFEEQWQHLFADASFASGDLSPRLASALNKGKFAQCSKPEGYFISLFEDPDLACPDILRNQEIRPIVPRLRHLDEDSDIVFLFDLRPWMLRSSVYNMLQTVFICAVLAVGAMVFSHDANVLVLQPIESMISKVAKIRDNPLYAMKLGDDTYREKQEEDDGDKSKKGQEGFFARCCKRQEAQTQTLETKILENAIIKLGKLLALGFGEAGSEIIGKNMDDESATVNAMIAGSKVEAVFGFANIRNFTDTTEVLQDKVMVFVNQVAEIVHNIVDTWHGAANRNIGDAFLIVWRIRDTFTKHDKRKIGDMSVISFVQVVAAINKSAVLKDYREHPALLARLPNYRVRMGFGLHYGWAIEGAIGSEFKIDASYLSPHVNMASRLEAVTKQYQVLILMSEPLTKLCSDEMVAHFRTIDHVTLKGGMSTSIHLHTVDLNAEGLSTDQVLPKQPQNPFELRMQREKAKEEKMQSTFHVHRLFASDMDIRIMRKDFPVRFFQTFAKGYLNYEAGEWDVAKEEFEATLNMLDEPDGPSKALLSFMSQYDFNSSKVNSTKGWRGWRELTEV